jgi:hypothetical protein
MDPLPPLALKTDDGYVPDADEIAQHEEAERRQHACHHANFNPEDGCPDCGYYAK